MKTSNEGLLCVQGQGHASRSPNCVALSLQVTAIEAAFPDAVASLNQKVDALGYEIEKVGRNRAELKSSDYQVLDRWGKKGKQTVHMGFDASLHLSLEVPLDHALLDRVLHAVTASSAQPTMSFAFTIKDKEPMRQEALAAAVADARKCAQTIADAAGIALGKIRHLEHGQSGMNVSSRNFEMPSSAPQAEGSPFPEVTPMDVSADDSVTITWEIAQASQ